MRSFRTHGSRLVGFALLGFLLWLAPAAQAATYTVTNTNNSGAGSLHQAILNANVGFGFDTIAFNIPGGGIHTIGLTSALPHITGITSIDGTTQPGYTGTPVIELDGSPGDVITALYIDSGGCGIKGLIINRFSYGIVLQNGSLNQITGNYIGTNAFGTVALGNTAGIYILDSSNNTIGGTTDATRNVISGNAITGILVQGTSPGNLIRGNRIGTNAAGTAALPNGSEGIAIFNGSNNNVIGGATVGEGNLISGNGSYGIIIGTDGNTIRGNYMGTNAAGTVALPNARSGLFLISASNNTVGGTTAGARNLISGNQENGIFIRSESGPATSNIVMGNYIGTDVTGLLGIGNGSAGVQIDDSNNNIIGGAAFGAGNLISGNGFNGVFIRTGASGNQVMGNIIGAAITINGRIPNSFSGIRFESGASNNRIGGTGAGEGNKIYYNLEDGIRLNSACVNNEFLGNSIYLNKEMGIDLAGDGPTANDAGDLDSGANNLQNYPVLSSVTLSGGNTTFAGTLNSKPNAAYRVEFFTHFACDSERGQGFEKVGVIPSLITNAGGNANFSVTLPTVNTSVDEFITALATDSAGNTSEFSPCTPIYSLTAGTLSFSSAAYNVSEGNATATVTVQRTVGSAGVVSVNYATSDGLQAKAPADYAATSGTLVFLNGETSKTFDVPLVNDALDEDDEKLNLTLSSPGGGASLGAPSTAVLTIADNDALPSISISDLSIVEGNAGTSQALFTVTLSAPSGRLVAVLFDTSDGTATAGSDYEAEDGGPDFVAGETSKTITVLIKGDPDVEADETFFVNLHNPTDSTIAKGQGKATIVNDDGPAGPAFSFTQTVYAAPEQLGSLTVTVTRSGDASAAAAVDYSTADGSATQKSDFEITAGTLNFAPGETSKTVLILLNQDMHIEGNESFNVVLSNPSGAVLGQPNATVTITDDVPESPNNPIDDPQSFVHTHYHDFLNREPDPAGLAFWTNQIASCGSDVKCLEEKRINISAAFFLSIEFQQTAYLRYLLEKESFGSLPKYAEFMRDLQEVSRDVVVNSPGWEQKLRGNQQQFAEAWVRRPAFKAAYDAMSNADYVNALYANAGVLPTQAERDSLVNALDTSSQSRASILLDVAGNVTFRQKENNSAFVLMQYFGYLRRDPAAAPDSDLSGYNFWLTKLNQFGGNYIDAEMIKAFITSIEYRQRFAQ